MEGAGISFTKLMLTTTLQKVRRSGVGPIFVARGYGSCGVAFASLADVVCEVRHSTWNAVTAPCYAVKGVLATGAAILTRRDWKTPLRTNASNAARKTAAAFQHLCKASQHLVGAPVALFFGALAPEKLLLPAMRLLDIAGDIDNPDPLWKRLSIITRGSLLGIGVGMGFLGSRLSSYHVVQLHAASLGHFIVGGVAIGGLMATCYVLGRYQRQPEPLRLPPAQGQAPPARELPVQPPPAPPSPRRSAPPAPQPTPNVPGTNGEAKRILDQLTAEWEKVWMCPISCGTMQNPLILNCGHMFENAEINKWLPTKNNCPMCNAHVIQKITPYSVKATYEVGQLILRQFSDLVHRCGTAFDVPNVAPTPPCVPLFFKPSFLSRGRAFMELNQQDARKDSIMVEQGYSKRRVHSRITFKDVSVDGGSVSYVRINVFLDPEPDPKPDFEIFLGSDDKTTFNRILQKSGFTPNPTDCLDYKRGQLVPRTTFNKKDEEVRMGVFIAREEREKQFAWELIKDSISVQSDREFVQSLINSKDGDWRIGVRAQYDYVDRERTAELAKEERAERERQRRVAGA